jgi:hypothetical protein
MSEQVDPSQQDETLLSRDYPVLEWSQPTPSNRKVLDAIHTRLQAGGFEPGPDGYDTEALTHGLDQRGWDWEYQAAGSGYRATVTREIAPSSPSSLSSHGWSPAVALARSIDQHLGEIDSARRR